MKVQAAAEAKAKAKEITIRDINNKNNIIDNIASDIELDIDQTNKNKQTNIDKPPAISTILVIDNTKNDKDKDKKLSLANIINQVYKSDNFAQEILKAL